MEAGLVMLQYSAHFAQHASFFHMTQPRQQFFFGNTNIVGDNAVRRRNEGNPLLHPPNNLSIHAIYHVTPTLLEIQRLL